MKEYILTPIMTPATLNRPAAADKSVVARPLPPPRQPLPTAVIDPVKPGLKLGLDVHLDFIMAVSQTGHTALKAPRKFTRLELVAQVQKWIAEGYQVFCVQESCGFGFTLHRELGSSRRQSQPDARAVPHGIGGGIWRATTTSRRSVHHSAVCLLWKTDAAGAAPDRRVQGARPAVQQPLTSSAADNCITRRMNNAGINLRAPDAGRRFVPSRLASVPGGQAGIKATLSGVPRRHSGGAARRRRLQRGRRLAGKPAQNQRFSFTGPSWRKHKRQ